MAFYGASDIDDMLAEFGVPVTLGAVTVNGIVDYSEAPIGGAEYGPGLVSRATLVRVKTGALPGLRSGVQLTVDGVVLTATEALQETDGAITIIHCVTKA